MNDKQYTEQLQHTIERTHFAFGRREEHDDWDTYITPEKIFRIATDRLIVAQQTLGTIPFKGQATVALYMALSASVKNIIETDIIDSPHPHLLVTKNCSAFPVSFRIYRCMIDPLWENYSKGLRNYHGHSLPVDIQKNQQLPSPVLVPIIHEKPTSKEMIFTEGLVDEEVYEEAEEICLNLFSRGETRAQSIGLLLARSHYSFGLYEGKLLLHYRFHDTDYATYWDESNKKERIEPSVVSNWLQSVGFNGAGKVPLFPDDIRIDAAKEYIALTERFVGSKMKFVLGEQMNTLLLAMK